MAKRGNGEGSIYQRKDGRWVGSVHVLTPDGRRVRKSAYGATRKEVAAKLAELISKTQKGLAASEDTRRVGEYLEAWLTDVVRHRLRPTTYHSYSINVRNHLIPGLGRKRLGTLRPGDVRTFLVAKREEGLSARTVQYLHAILRAALQHAVREELLSRNVAKLVQPGPVRRDEINPLTAVEARALLAAAKGHRFYPLYAVAVALGLRRSEALGLSWADVDLVGRTLTVRQTLHRSDGQLVLFAPKTAKSRRTIPLPTICVDALRAHCRRQNTERAQAGERWQETGLVFTTTIGTPIEPRNLNRHFYVLCAKAGVRRVRLHDLRHTCASLLLAQGVPARVVMELLGHSAIAVTMNVYSHVMPAASRDATDKIGSLLGEDPDAPTGDAETTDTDSGPEDQNDQGSAA
ncbi:site-specific integrase [Frankia sp. Cas3]|uniref:tyrosine-type recombinase/integrase n=1 Tax=Frankia sp. Cas3 TaxID=3073926 RepID=UPI002AD253F1|nr:site-specific integrase [Frankia sp. Cas3]